MNNNEILIHSLWQIGPLEFTISTLTSWGILLCLACVFGLVTRRLNIKPDPVQNIAEAVVNVAEKAVQEVLPNHYLQLTPFILSLWLFLIVANLTGLIPGLHSPTRDISVTAALAIIVFFSVHWFGIKTQGLKQYLQHYLTPSPVLLPFHILSEITRTLALAVRLFGNMMSLEMVAMLLLFIAGFLVPVPILMLHIIEALVQAYIFGMLTLIYIASAIQTQETSRQMKQQE